MVAIHVIVVAAVAVIVAILLAAVLAVVVVLRNVVVVIVVFIVGMRVTRRFIALAFAMFLVLFPFFMKSHVSCLLIRDTSMYEGEAKKVWTIVPGLEESTFI